MEFNFEKLATFDISATARSENVLSKLQTAFNLCWELPQTVADRIFSSKQLFDDFEVEDRNQMDEAIKAIGYSGKINSIEQSRLVLNKYLAIPRFRTNVNLAILTAFSQQARLFLACFAAEIRQKIDHETDDVKMLTHGRIPFAFAVILAEDASSMTFFLSPCPNDHPLAATTSSIGLSPGWLQYGLAKKILTWVESQDFETAPSQQPRSMHLVDHELYLPTYLSLKESIGSYWIKNWPERTDPQKFVFEELAIAVYLITFWRQNGCKKVSFADLGCGNGFLTYALNNANLPDITIEGFGIDARKRNIWDIYGNMKEKLIEAPVSSEKLDVFSGIEWFIGNHSDELTPWIPYIASKCGPHAKVFVLPCCPFDFHGKYRLRVGGKSLYGGYLDYIERLCSLCGFKVQKDRLRIPSTKRVCFICTERSKDMDEMNLNELASLVKTKETSSQEPMIPKVPEVRNCTAISAELKSEMLKEIFALILDKNNEDFVVVKSENGKDWRAGGRLLFSEAMKRLSQQSTEALKNQDGGLKTFCKNYSFIFTVVNSCGSVYLRRHPVAVEFLASRRSQKTLNNNNKNKNSSANIKKRPVAAERPCIFESYHPDGCPYWPSSECHYSYLHSQQKKLENDY